jgi:NTE family protein
MAKRPPAHEESTCRRCARPLRLFGVLAGLSALYAGEAFACQKDESGRPTVGLVLSGGGALAASQVGAIKALEENGVPVHCIVGTSMGAVVGALYASGHDADKLKDIFVNADWGSISTGRLPYREQGYRTKEDDRDFFSDYVIGVGKEGIVLPSGLTSLRGMRRYIRQETEQVAHESDFDRLPIPFRATATDLSTGESVTLAKGDLVDAALASMAVPGLYPSQKIDGRTLIDGGMSKQVPIDIARAMGADIVIVVDNTLAPANYADRTPSVVETVMQLVGLQVWRNHQEQIKQLESGDVHIVPDMTGYSTSGFDKVDEGFDVGYEAALAHVDRLRAIAAEAAPSRARTLPPSEQITISSVTVSSTSGISENLIRNRFGVKAGDVVTRADVHDGLDNVAALASFDVVDYSLTPGPDGSAVDIVTVPRGAGNQHLQLGVKLSTTIDGDAYYGLLGRWTIKPLNAYAGELKITAEIGTNLEADVEWMQPAGSAGRFYVESGLNYTARTVPVNIDEVRLAERRDKSSTARVILGRELGQWGVVEFGGFATTLDTEIRVGDTLGLGVQSGDYVGIAGRFAIDTYNSPSFPIEGQVVDLRLSDYEAISGGDAQATLGQLVLASAQTVGPFATFIRYEGGILDQNTPALPPFTLGGFKRLSGFEDNSVPATEYSLFRLEGFMRLGADVEQTFGVPVYLGATLEGAAVGFDLSGVAFDNDFYAGSIYGAVDTVLGPAYLAYGLGESGRQSIYLYFGRRF